MKDKQKNLFEIVLGLISLQASLLIWEKMLGLFIIQDEFAYKMITMFGMIILTVVVIVYSKKMNIKIPFFPKKFSRKYVIVTILAVTFLIATPSNYVDGIRGPLLLIYGSIVTPLYEELLFRGCIWSKLENAWKQSDHIVWINTILFSVWHLGYIIDGLIVGEWMALSKLVIGFVYGMIVCFVRKKTKNCYSTFLVHSILNAFLG